MRRFWPFSSPILFARAAALGVFLCFSVSAPAQMSGAPARALPDFADLAERQGQVVVNISTTQIVRRSGSLPGFSLDENDPMNEFFRRFMPRLPGVPNAPREMESHSLGSGFLISADGYILTNAHVVDSAEEINVRLNDRREFRARAIGADKRTDVALLKIDATNLPFAKMGNPDKLRVGEWVIAIGSPFGFENSVTAGIVSAKGRSLPQENYVPFIQTDVAVNPGNSGGPLFNLAGEVIGINSQIYSRSGGFMGLSFAIPIDVAMDVQGQLRASGKVVRGRLGVAIQEITRELAESFGLEKAAGALVSSVEKDGPAAHAGIEEGDVILRFDNKAIVRSEELPRVVGATHPGSKVKVHLWRKGAMREIWLTVGEIQEETVSAPRKERSASAGREATRLGLVVSELSAGQKKQTGLSGGLLIEEIKSNAARVDLRVGDIITALVYKGVMQEVKNLAQVNKLLAPLEKNSSVTLQVWRDGMQSFIAIRSLGE
ncbi:MAG: DegQ family serine endoprotease [Zoogloeaceae bacterium]|jgi:serine protease Do|nr:DegQ family serine endoprotease [Zoogloeaceae bacterium]